MGQRGKVFATAMVAGGLLCGGVVAAEPAAAVSGVVMKIVDSARDSVGGKTAQAVCPPGKRVVGGGGSVAALQGQVKLTRMQPVQDSRGGRYVVSAEEDQDGFSGKWSVRAYAICASSLPGLRIVSATSPSNSNATRLATANCSSGQRVLGAGARIIDGKRQVSLQGNLVSEGRPSAPNIASSYAAGAEDRDGFSGKWGITSYAICVNPVPGYTVVRVFSPSNSILVKAGTATCPSGTSVHAAAGYITAPRGRVVLSTVAPDLGRRAVHVTAEEDQGSEGKNWGLITMAVCAR